jgi:hypothetical protein
VKLSCRLTRESAIKKVNFSKWSILLPILKFNMRLAHYFKFLFN